jgi:hypothetical protein
LFLLGGSVRRFEQMLDELGARGHEVHVAVRIEPRGFKTLIGRLGERHPGITRGVAAKRTDRWAPLAEALGLGIDYLRFLGPEYANAPKLRTRAEQWAPTRVVRLSRRPLVCSRPGIRVLARAMHWLERAIPDSPQILEFLRSQRPDLVIVSPLVKSSSQAVQADYVRAARSLGIRCAVLVRGWDSLTNKGLIREVPDRVYVCNDQQRAEAIELHGVPAQRVAVTGVYWFDHWFGATPSTGATEFAERLALVPRRPIVLYACSSRALLALSAGNETMFVERWLRALREHPDQRLRTASVLIRPHPSLCDRWWDSPVREMPGVAVWPLEGPRQGKFSFEGKSRSGYFDSLFHSAAVVGLNTSALIEAAILGRPVFTVLDPEYRETQEGTLHFHYLPRANGGPVTVAGDLPEHLEQLAQSLSRDGQPDPADREFVRRFVRPRGLERPAVGVLVDALEAQLRAPAPQPQSDRARRAVAAMAMRPIAVLADRSRRSTR